MIAPGTQGPVADEKEKSKQAPPDAVAEGDEEEEEEEEEAVNGTPAAGAHSCSNSCRGTMLIVARGVCRGGKEKEEEEEVQEEEGDSVRASSGWSFKALPGWQVPGGRASGVQERVSWATSGGLSAY